ncbi:MAG: sensor domain-containing diguanylate cyclase [Candidatus Aegiribacteria sp.]|nr:sensor domain-containing diguanylate cyclase [Candidatus Aegiribacteria sp.]
MVDYSDELLTELFWRSSLRIAVLDSRGHIILTSKAFRDSFLKLVRISINGSEVLELPHDASGGESYFDRLASLPPGERFSFSVRLSFAGVETGFRIETTALSSKKRDKPLFLTEWIPGDDPEAIFRTLNEIEQKYRNLQENLPVGIYRADEKGILQTANSALIKMMGYDSFEELQDAPLEDVWIDPVQRTLMIERLRKEGAVLNYEVHLRRRNGDEMIGSYDARGTFDAAGILVHFDTIVQDITRRVQAITELERLARTDSLTGLFNRQYLMERFEEEIARAGRYDRPLAAMLIDLDHFKMVNDTHGHLAGDTVLVSAVSCITGILRETDFAGRYGGEEFCVVLPETGKQGALELAERLRRTTEDTDHVLTDGSKPRITCSIGLAEASSRSVEATIALADEVLYDAKRSGRNRVGCSTVLHSQNGKGE